jgi:hypothetical protein
LVSYGEVNREHAVLAAQIGRFRDGAPDGWARTCLFGWFLRLQIAMGLTAEKKKADYEKNLLHLITAQYGEPAPQSARSWQIIKI